MLNIYYKYCIPQGLVKDKSAITEIRKAIRQKYPLSLMISYEYTSQPVQKTKKLLNGQNMGVTVGGELTQML